MSPPDVEAVVVYFDPGYRGFQDAYTTDRPAHVGGEDAVEGRWLPAPAFDALLARLNEAEARANTAKVAADLMRARAEKAERERDEAVNVADVATDAAAKAVLDAKEVYEVRHLKRIEEVTKERDEAVALLKEAHGAIDDLADQQAMPDEWYHGLLSRIDALTKARG